MNRLGTKNQQLDRVRLMFDKYQALDHHRESVRVCVSIYIYIYMKSLAWLQKKFH